MRHCELCSIKLNGNRKKTICIDCEKGREHRKCSNCNNAIRFESKTGLCISCWQLGSRNNQYGKSSWMKDRTGEKHHLFGKPGALKGRFGEDHPNFGSHWKLSEETKKKQRIAACRNLKFRKGVHQPNYNPEACRIIEEYGKDNGYNFQHAENGGEFFIEELGYWVDGYDKDKNVVIEYYEKFHRRQKDHDLKRQKEIEDILGCKFIVLGENE